MYSLKCPSLLSPATHPCLLPSLSPPSSSGSGWSFQHFLCIWVCSYASAFLYKGKHARDAPLGIAVFHFIVCPGTQQFRETALILFAVAHSIGCMYRSSFNYSHVWDFWLLPMFCIYKRSCNRNPCAYVLSYGRKHIYSRSQQWDCWIVQPLLPNFSPEGLCQFANPTPQATYESACFPTALPTECSYFGHQVFWRGFGGVFTRLVGEKWCLGFNLLSFVCPGRYNKTPHTG